MFKKKRSSKKLDENEEGLKETMVLYTIPKQMPSEEEVLSIFHNILNDLDMDKSKRIPLEAWSSIEKWNFIKLQIEQDKTTPTPDKVLFNLKNNLTLQELETLALHLSRLRISWCTRFIEIGGPKFLLTLLARLDNDIIVDEIVDDQLIINCLHCLKNLCNYTNGLREVSQYPHFIPNIINLMDPNQDITIEYSLQILCSFLFSDYVQDSHLTCESISRTIGKSLKFKTWIALYSGIHRNPQSSVSSVICSFLSGMWMAMFDDEDIRWEHVLRYKKFKIINELRKNSLQHELVKSLELEMKYLQLVFPQKLFNMFDNNEVITTLSTVCQHPNIPHSVLLMCIELSQHDEKLFNNLMLYIYNLIFIVRMKYKINDPINFIYFSQIASQCNKPLTVEVSNNIVSQEMALKHLFFPLFELPTNKNNFNSIINQAVSDFTPQPISTASAQHNSLHMKTNQSSNSSNAKCQNFDTSQLKDALSQIEGLKKALDVSTKEKEKLKSEIQKLKNELEASSGKVIQGTPSILIPQTTISDEKYEIQRLKSEILQKREELSLFRHGNPNAEIISKDKMIDLLQKRILELEKNKTIIDELKSKLEDFERKDQNGDVMNAKIEELSEMMLNFKATIKAKDDHINQLEKGISDLKQKISNLSHTQRRMTVLKGSQNLEQALPPIPPSEKINSAADESQKSFPIPPPDDVPIKFSYNHFANNNNENKYQDLQRKSNSFIPIFWSKVPNIIAYNSFWKSINEIDVNINESEIESLFRYQDDLINSPKIPTPSKVFDKVSRTMNLIDPKHIKSTNILLSRLSKSVDEICYLIQNLSQQLTEDEILDLSSFSPTEDEKVAILSFEGDSSNLCNAEYFYYKILRIELLDEHLEFLRLRNNFPKILYDIELQTKLINNALISLITSPTFKHLLALILKIGNFVNVGLLAAKHMASMQIYY